MSDIENAPRVIYLQWNDPPDDDVTWCVDEINDSDVAYIRMDIDQATLKKLRLATIALNKIARLYHMFSQRWVAYEMRRIARDCTKELKGE
jgi:hypothetical protein